MFLVEPKLKGVDDTVSERSKSVEKEFLQDFI